MHVMVKEKVIGVCSIIELIYCIKWIWVMNICVKRFYKVYIGYKYRKVIKTSINSINWVIVVLHAEIDMVE